MVVHLVFRNLLELLDPLLGHMRNSSHLSRMPPLALTCLVAPRHALRGGGFLPPASGVLVVRFSPIRSCRHGVYMSEDE